MNALEGPPTPVDAVVYWAGGLALRHLRELDEAAEWLGLALAACDEQDHTAISLTLAGTLVLAGRLDTADEILAAASTEGPVGARVAFQRAVVANRRGDLDRAERGFTEALASFRAYDDELGEAHAQSSLGLVDVDRGHAARAIPRFGLARALYRDLGLGMLATLARHNLGYAALRAGDLATAVDQFTAAEEELREVGEPFAEVALDRAEALLLLGATGRAAAVAVEALRTLDHAAADTERAESLVALGRAFAASGRRDLARRAFAAAVELFSQQGRTGWEHVVAVRRLTAEPDVSVVEAVEVARNAHADGNHDVAADADLFVVEHGRAGSSEVEGAYDRLGRLDGADHRRQVATLLRLGREGRDAEVAAQAVLTLDRTRRSVDLTTPLDLRSGVVSRQRHALRLGVQAALRAGDARAVIDLALAAQRVVFAPLAKASAPVDLARAAASGDLPVETWRDLVGRRGHVPETSQPVDDPLIEPYPVLVLIDDGERLAAARLRPDGSSELLSAGSRTDVLDALRRHQVLLTRAAHDPSTVAVGAVTRSRDSVVDVLPWLEDAVSVNFLPVGGVASAPWSALFSGAVTVVVDPRASRGAERPRSSTVAVGPRLLSSDAEVAAVRDSVPDVTVVPHATDVDVLGVGGDLLHLVCHGHHDADSPLLSSYETYGRRLTGMAVAAQPGPPAVVLAAACRAGDAAGEERLAALGLSTAWVAAGSRAVVAPCGPIPDDRRTAETMSALHGALRAGTPPARAIGVAGERADVHVAATLVCSGRPWREAG